MKNSLLFLIFNVCLLHGSFAQKNVQGSVKGTLTDTAYLESMADATVSVMHATDSSVLSYTRADEKGAFIIKNLDAGNYRLVISFQGYETAQRKFSVSAASPDVNLGKINMTKANDMLEEVIVERPPIVIKGDTVEFSASAFKTKPNAVAEDLLKKLPGVEVDMDGNVTAQGEAIQKIYVDGKEFFGSDPKMATKNITADMIESVQVFDDMSDQAKFTRIDDGSRSKTINIKLKKNMRKGYFGRATVAHSEDNLYLGSAMLNRFNNDSRLSVLGSTNNINRQGFTSKDIVSGMGGFGGGRGGGGRRGGGGGSAGDGITKSTSLGVNYTDVIANKLQVQGSYMYGETKTNSLQSSYRRTIYPQDDSYQERDSITNSYSNDNSYNVNRNHNFNLRLEYEIDSMNSILYTPNLTLQYSNDYSYNTDSTRVTIPDAGLEYLGLGNMRKNINKRNGLTLNNELLYRRRFKKFGRTFTLGFKNSINNSDGEGKTFSKLTFYNPEDYVDSMRIQDFLSSQETRSTNTVISTSYTEPIGKNKLIEFNYAYTDKLSTSDRNALSYRDDSKQYDSINPQQTNYFKNAFIAHRAGLNFKYSNNGYGFQVGGSMQASSLDNKSIRGIYSTQGIDTVIHTRQSYVNFFPTANFHYDFSRRKNIRIQYQGRTNQPNVRQLQDVRDETNTLRTSVGNPGLKQEFSNKIHLSYKTFNETTYRYLNVNVNYNQTSNKIVNSIGPDTSRGKGVQLIKPVNLNGAYDASYDISFGLPLRKGVKGSSINMGNRMRYGRDVSRLNERNNYTHSFSVSQSFGLNLDIQEKLNMEFRGSFSYNSASYSVQQSRTDNLNNKYFSQRYSTDINYYVLKNLILSTDFNYTVNSGRAEGYNLSIPLWNGGIAYQLFPKKNGEIKFTVNDILNQNSNIDRSIGENYYSDSRTVILQRYFLLSFTYNFNRFGQRGDRSQQGREFRTPGSRGEGGMWRGGGGGGRGDMMRGDF